MGTFQPTSTLCMYMELVGYTAKPAFSGVFVVVRFTEQKFMGCHEFAYLHSLWNS